MIGRQEEYQDETMTQYHRPVDQSGTWQTCKNMLTFVSIALTICGYVAAQEKNTIKRKLSKELQLSAQTALLGN